MPGVIDRLTGMLARATFADLDELDGEIARLAALRSLVADALALPPTVAQVAPDPPKPAPALTAPKSAAKPGARGELGEQRRLAVARLLADGPLGLTAIARRCNIPDGGISAVIKCEWFTKAGGGKRDPWTLTDAGRKAIAPDRGN